MVPRQGDDRFRRLLLRALLLLPVYLAVLFVLLWSLSDRAGFALAGAALMTALVTVSGAVQALATYTPRLVRARVLLVMLVTWAMMPGTGATLVLLAFRVEPGWALAGGLGVAAVGLGAYSRMRRSVVGHQVLTPLQPESLSDAELLRLAATRPAPRQGLSPETYAIQRLNHARASIMLAMRESDHDRVTEAFQILREVIEGRHLAPAVALTAGDDLVNAESTLAERSRDGRRYDSAVRLYARLVAENPDLPVGRARLHLHQAGYQQFVMREAMDAAHDAAMRNDDAAATAAAERAGAAYHDAEREIRAAIHAAPQQTGLHAECLTLLGMFLCSVPDDSSRLDEGVDAVRGALALRTPDRRSHRPLGELSLALCLRMRAETRHLDAARRPQVTADLDEAQRLASGLVRLGNPIEARARSLLIDIAELRGRLP